MIFKGKLTGKVFNWSMNINPAFKNIEKFIEGVQWYMKSSNDFFSKISLELKNEHGELVSFNGRSVSFRLSIEKV